jgi:hypothetical protein
MDKKRSIINLSRQGRRKKFEASLKAKVAINPPIKDGKLSRY